MKLAPEQRSQIERLAPHLDRVAEADREFFAKHPDRRHRVRFATETEIAEAEIVDGKLLKAPEGHRWFTITRKLPGARLRVFVAAPAGTKTGTDLDEDIAAALFDTVAPSGLNEIETALRAAFGGGAK
jgi:hypothetical protein